MGQVRGDTDGVIGPHGILLHPGAPFAATWSVQTSLAAIRQQLWDEGLVYPGNDRNHVPATRAALGLPNFPREAASEARKWAALQRTIARHQGRAIVSSELLARCDEPRAREVIDALGGHRVHIVVTLSPLATVIPTAWQESVKLGESAPFGDFVEQVVALPDARDSAPAGRFWAVHHHGELVRRWANLVGPDRVTVVAVDRAQPHAVLAAFEQLIGLASGALTPAPTETVERPPTWLELESVRVYNTMAAAQSEHDKGPEMLPLPVISLLMESRVPPAGEARPVLPRSAITRLAPIAAEIVDSIASSGVRVIGNLDALRPVVEDDVPEPTEPSVAPLEAVAHLLRAVREFERRSQMAASELRAAERLDRRRRRGDAVGSN